MRAVKLDLKTDKNTLWNSGDCEATQTGTDTCTHTIAYALNTHMDLVLYICGSGGVGA
jgi:hypothetical protein